ncbi:MAG: hypothetical protein WC775_06105 [Patescibacteria group bacterium]|jgi:hypothetical protein
MSVEHTIAAIGLELIADTPAYDAIRHHGEAFQHDVFLSDPNYPTHSGGDIQYSRVTPRPVFGTLVEHISAQVLPSVPHFSAHDDERITAERLEIYDKQLFTGRLHTIRNLRVESASGRASASMGPSSGTPTAHPGVLTHLSVLQESGMIITEEIARSYVLEALTYSLGQHIENMLTVVNLPMRKKSLVYASYSFVLNITRALASYSEARLLQTAIDSRYPDPMEAAFYMRENHIAPMPEKQVLPTEIVQIALRRLRTIGRILDDTLVTRLMIVLQQLT